LKHHHPLKPSPLAQAGHYRDNAACVPCEAGQFKTSVGDDACTPCADGETTLLPGSTNSSACQPPACSALFAADFHTCVVTSDGSVKCWGENGYGQLGLGDTDDRGDEAGEMGASTPPFSAGATFLCLDRDARTLEIMSGMESLNECWLGWQANLPFVDLDGAVAVAITTGYWHSCALLVRGVQCVRGLLWGCGFGLWRWQLAEGARGRAVWRVLAGRWRT